MKFKALPVRCGDSFLLECEGKIILVDGGKNQRDILTILNKENILNHHIDLLICTHYDADHINGIVGVLKSNKYSFNELWLPEIFGSIAYTFANATNEIFDYIRHNDNLERFTTQSVIENNQQRQVDSVDDSFELIDNESLSYLIENYFWGFDYMYHFGYRNHDEHYFKMIINLHKISTLINYSISSGAYIRWFSYRNSITSRTYGYDMYSKNSIQTKITKYTPTLFFQKLYLTTINKESLVFLFDKELFPNVLFTADSDLSFCNSINLKDNSIVTAPHHGSMNNDTAYPKILGANLIFVRSDNSQIKRPGQGYLNQSQRYCTICRNLNQKHIVELILSNSIFTTNANSCIC
jgi:hypothetical protein